jgi:hypothetical protein
MTTRLGSTPASWGAMFGSMGASVSKAQADTIVDRAQVVR